MHILCIYPAYTLHNAFYYESYFIKSMYLPYGHA